MKSRFFRRYSLADQFSGPRLKAALAALLSLSLFTGVWWGGHRWYKGQLLADQRARIMTELSPYSNALSRAINRRLDLLRELKAFVETHALAPSFPAEFATFAAGLYAGTAGIRHFVAAPGGVLRYVYPLKGSESVLGYDTLHDPRPHVRADVERAIQSRLPIISGPFELLPGGLGFVGRLAVYVNGKFWGLVSVAVDLPAILEETGIQPHTAGLLLALRNELGHPFFGNGAVFNDQPVLHRIELVEGFWELAAVPRGGWDASIRKQLRLFDTAGLAIVSLLTALVYLLVHRDARLALNVQRRTEEIARVNKQLETDIAERKRAEEALRKSEEQLEARVQQRTAELEEANEELQTQIAERKRAEEETLFLLTITQGIADSEDFQAALRVALRKICEATGWDYGEAWTPTSDGMVLECSPAWCQCGKGAEEFRTLSEDFTFAAGVGLPGRVWASRQPEWVKNMSTEPVEVCPRAEIALKIGLKAALGLPIIAGDQVLAVLAFFMFESREEDRRLIEIVSAVATQLGSLIQRKRAEQALRQARDELDMRVQERTAQLVTCFFTNETEMG